MTSPGSSKPAESQASSSLRSPVRPLEGLVVGISIGLGEDSSQYGFSAEEEVNRAVLRLSDSLLAAGARLVFGHDWRPTGVMSAVARLAVTYDPPMEPVHDGQPKVCRITNLVPWDRKPELPEDLRTHLEQRGILRIEQISPAGAASAFPEMALPDLSRSSKAVFAGMGLLVLRRRLAELCDARVCLGGKFEKYEGFVPGILEEALNSAKKPARNCVLLSGLMGGAARKILRASATNDWNALVALPLAPAVEQELRNGFVRSLREAYRREAPKYLAQEELIARSGLDADDWQRLVEASDIEVVAAMIVKALSRRATSH